MRYKEFEIVLMNKQNEVIGIDVHEDVPAKITIDMDKVISFGEAFGDDKEDDLGGAIIVHLSDGTDFFLKISYSDFKKQLL